MKIRFVAVLVLVTCLLAGSLYSVPGNGTEVTQFLTRSDLVQGTKEVGTHQTFFQVQNYDDMDGVAQGSVFVFDQDFATGTYKFISCNGPAFANSVSVNVGNGKSSVNVTLDLVPPSCFSLNVLGPVTIAVTGEFNGTSQVSQNGTGKSTSFGESSKFNFTSDSFSETFTGTLGFDSGTFTGTAETSRRNDRTRVK